MTKTSNGAFTRQNFNTGTTRQRSSLQNIRHSNRVPPPLSPLSRKHQSRQEQAQTAREAAKTLTNNRGEIRLVPIPDRATRFLGKSKPSLKFDPQKLLRDLDHEFELGQELKAREEQSKFISWLRSDSAANINKSSKDERLDAARMLIRAKVKSHSDTKSLLRKLKHSREVPQGLSLTKTQLNDMKLLALDFSKVKSMHKINLQNSNCAFSNFSGQNLSHADLRNTSLHASTLKGANLKGARLERTSFIGANLIDAKLPRNLKNADFSFAILRGQNFAGKDLSGISFYGADLRGADLRGAKLHGAELRFADLTGAKLDTADFSATEDTEPYHQGADLRGAKLYDVIADQAIFRGSKLSIDTQGHPLAMSGSFKDADFSDASFNLLAWDPLPDPKHPIKTQNQKAVSSLSHSEKKKLIAKELEIRKNTKQKPKKKTGFKAYSKRANHLSNVQAQEAKAKAKRILEAEEWFEGKRKENQHPPSKKAYQDLQAERDATTRAENKRNRAIEKLKNSLGKDIKLDGVKFIGTRLQKPT